MTIQDINNQLKLKQTELQITQDVEKRQAIQNRIKVLQYKKEIEEIRKRIEQLSS